MRNYNCVIFLRLYVKSYRDYRDLQGFCKNLPSQNRHRINSLIPSPIFKKIKANFKPKICLKSFENYFRIRSLFSKVFRLILGEFKRNFRLAFQLFWANFNLGLTVICMYIIMLGPGTFSMKLMDPVLHSDAFHFTFTIIKNTTWAYSSLSDKFMLGYYLIIRKNKHY